MENAAPNTPKPEASAGLERPLSTIFQFNWEVLIFAVIVLLAIATRFYLLEPRVMSHDETSHVVYSWKLYRGEGYIHDPMMHGPLQFHLVALSFQLFGDNDFTARIPAAVFSVMTVAFLWNFRRYLGRVGALVAAFLFVISPYMLFYGRYVRNEAFVAFFGVVTLWALLRYFETGQTRYLTWLAVATVLHFTSKETSYIYTAELLLFTGGMFLWRILQKTWPNPLLKKNFWVCGLIAVGLLGIGLIVLRVSSKATSAAETPAVQQNSGVQVQPNAPPQPAAAAETTKSQKSPLAVLFIGLGACAVLLALYWLVTGNIRPGKGVDLKYFAPCLAAVALLLALALGYGFLQTKAPWIQKLAAAPVAANAAATTNNISQFFYLLLAAAVPIGLAVGLGMVGYSLGRTVSLAWPLGQERTFDILYFTATLILPTLSAFLINLYASVTSYALVNIAQMLPIVLPFFGLSIGLGLGWNKKVWGINALIFYGIFVLFYTTFFTNLNGFFSGIVGSLGYWIAQQGEKRGLPVPYYYALIQIPMYEFLPALGTLLAFILLLIKRPLAFYQRLGFSEPARSHPKSDALVSQTPPVFSLLGFWSIASLVAFSIAGEKMPWLTVHITLSMLLLAGWCIGYLIETTAWTDLFKRKGVVVALLAPVFLYAILGIWKLLLEQIQRSAKAQGDLQISSSLQPLEKLGGWLVVVGSLIAVLYFLWVLLKDWHLEMFGRLAALLGTIVLAALTARAAFTASYINYDYPTEFLVFAHCGPGPKIALKQIEAISRRMTGGLGIQVAHDDKTTYPFWWYLRDYTNVKFYGNEPSMELRTAPLILVSDSNFAKIEPIVRRDYYMFEYARMWWPNQDFTKFDDQGKLVNVLTPKLVWEAITDPNKRDAILDIWLNRDYTGYQNAYGKDMSLAKWDPSERFRLYVRKDVASTLWSYTTNPSAIQPIAIDNAYDKAYITLAADQILGAAGKEQGQFLVPHGMAQAADGSFYVADSDNHRIQHFAADGTSLEMWGSQVESKPEQIAPPGTFNQPWDVAVGPDGSVYVADTWNHRIQKFTADGKAVTAWGSGIISDPQNLLGFYGPRGIAVDSDGRVFITDTGNKRVVIFDAKGKPLGQFGSGGSGQGQFEEPVGIDVDKDGLVYVADTWNQRIQIFKPAGDNQYTFDREILVDGWYNVTATNYPYIQVGSDGHIFITDPDGAYVMELDAEGQPVRMWGGIGATDSTFTLPSGLLVTSDGKVWVADSGNSRLMRFTLPAP